MGAVAGSDAASKADTTSSDEQAMGQITDDMKTMPKQASKTLVSLLGGHKLRVVRSVMGQLCEMVVKLDARYNFESTVSKISRMGELVSTKYSSLREDMSKHIEKLVSLLKQLSAVEAALPDMIAVGLLLSLIEVTSLISVHGVHQDTDGQGAELG